MEEPNGSPESTLAFLRKVAQDAKVILKDEDKRKKCAEEFCSLLGQLDVDAFAERLRVNVQERESAILNTEDAIDRRRLLASLMSWKAGFLCALQARTLAYNDEIDSILKEHEEIINEIFGFDSIDEFLDDDEAQSWVDEPEKPPPSTSQSAIPVDPEDSFPFPFVTGSVPGTSSNVVKGDLVHVPKCWANAKETREEERGIQVMISWIFPSGCCVPKNTASARSEVPASETAAATPAEPEQLPAPVPSTSARDDLPPPDEPSAPGERIAEPMLPPTVTARPRRRQAIPAIVVTGAEEHTSDVGTGPASGDTFTADPSIDESIPRRASQASGSPFQGLLSR